MVIQLIACRYGLRVPIRKLIERGADADYENKFGMTPLIEACKAGYSLLIPTLLFDEQKHHLFSRFNQYVWEN